MDIEKICVLCKSFYFYPATPGYSDMTPGSNASMGCYKDLVEFDFWDDTTEEYRAKILTARTCPEFEPVGDNPA